MHDYNAQQSKGLSRHHYYRITTSLNQFYNQRRAKLQSLLKGNRQSSQGIRRLTRCRNQKIDNYLHRASRYLVNLLVEQEITTLVRGC
ncbi:transposase [Microcystis aeruginosa]|uniref:transposase n=1 Tax=Microcystis aeruginosa TaxID=1126 RepID=UPI00278C180D|nr:transposase [Microcystis aeruginosa]